MHFQKPYFHIPSRLKRQLKKDLLERLEEKQEQLQKASSKGDWWEEMRQRGDNLGHGVRKFRYKEYRILAVVESKWQCMWAYGIYHKDREPRIDENLLREIQGAREAWGIEEELERAWNQQQEALKQSRRKPSLPPEDREWLTFPNQFLTEKSYLVLESQNWYKAVSQKSRDWLEVLHNLLSNLLKDLRASQSPKRGTYPENGQGGMQIHYQWFLVHLPNHTKGTWVLYLQGVSSSSNSKKDSICEDFPQNWEEAAKRAWRAYPAMALEDKDLWIRITTVQDLPVWEGIAATLALSEEEIEILTQPAPRPLFINGRAGSGKTTLLYWLFAEYLIQAWDWHQATGKPFHARFLTYSERLRNAARDQVRTILRIHPMVEVVLDGPFSGRAEKEVLESIQTFREFLLQELRRLSDPEDMQRFDRENYIDFPRFREEYLNSTVHRSIKRRFSPEQAWFAIRALILGYDADFEMDADWYTEIFGRKGEKVFSEEDFQTLYESVYLQWYRKQQETEGWWNEVDLARKFVRLLRQAPEQRPHDFGFHLLVVDEAQDFTRVEFQLLFSVLYWSRFALSQEDWEQVPLILAGDPLQTINPTGFRWAYVKDLFNKALGELDIPPLSLQLKSLKKNYRSTQSLVCLSNAVLAWRRRLFRERGEKRELYQEAWDAQELPVRPTLYPFDPQVFAQHISDKNFVVIGPWFSNQEDNELYKTWRDLKPRELLSPEEAKGLEYERVILAGFGRAWREVSQSQSKDELKERLFWARLYVALTRARKDIAIVEYPQDRAFWRKHFIDFEEDPYGEEGFPENCVSPFLDEAQSAEEFGLKEENWLSLARNMYERARRERSAKWFAQAAKYFENAREQGEVSDEERLLVEEEYMTSQFYAALLEGKLRDALAVLRNGSFNFTTKPSHETLLRELTLETWRHEQWDLVQEVAKLHPGSGTLREFLHRIGTFMKSPSLEGAFGLLDELGHWQSIPLLSIKPHDDHRSEEVLRQVLLQWLGFLKQNLPAMLERQKRHLAQQLSLPTPQDILEEVLGQEGSKELAGLFFEIGRDTQTRGWLRKACELWEQTQSTGSREYAYARAWLSNQLTEALVWWVKAGEYDQALQVYQSLLSLPSCQEDFWKRPENRKALVHLWQRHKPDWKRIKNLDDLFSWLDCFWEVSRREAVQLWKEMRDFYVEEQKRWHGWLKRRIERGIPYEAWREITKVLFLSEQKDFRASFLQAVARHPQRLERFLDAVRKQETSLESGEWPLLLEAWGHALQKAEKEDRLMEWADLRNNFTLQEQIQKQFQGYLLTWIEDLHQRKSAFHLWRLYEWLLGGEQPEQALWDLFTGMYRQARKPSQRAFFVEQIYIRRRAWKSIPDTAICDFIKQLLTDLGQRRLEPQNQKALLEQIAELIKLCKTFDEERGAWLELASNASPELRSILEERDRQGSKSEIRPRKDTDQPQAQPRGTFPEALQDDLVLMLHGRDTPFKRVRQWYGQASLQDRKSMLEILLRESELIRKEGVPPEVRKWLCEIAQASDLPHSLVTKLRERFCLK